MLKIQRKESEVKKIKREGETMSTRPQLVPFWYKFKHGLIRRDLKREKKKKKEEEERKDELFVSACMFFEKDSFTSFVKVNEEKWFLFLGYEWGDYQIGLTGNLTKKAYGRESWKDGVRREFREELGCSIEGGLDVKVMDWGTIKWKTGKADWKKHGQCIIPIEQLRVDKSVAKKTVDTDDSKTKLSALIYGEKEEIIQFMEKLVKRDIALGDNIVSVASMSGKDVLEMDKELIKNHQQNNITFRVGATGGVPPRQRKKQRRLSGKSSVRETQQKPQYKPPRRKSPQLRKEKLRKSPPLNKSPPRRKSPTTRK